MTVQPIDTHRFPKFEGERVRDRLIEALRADLLGPMNQDEELPQSPATRYLVGMLAPGGTAIDPTEDDDLSTVDPDEDEDGKFHVATALAQSSIGISFVVPAGTSNIVVSAEWGDYEKLTDSEVEEQLESPDDGGEESSGDAATHKTIFRRIPVHKTETLELSGAVTKIDLGTGISLQWLKRPLGPSDVVSIFLVNKRRLPTDGSRPPDETWIYQPKLKVDAPSGGILQRDVAREYPNLDADVASADLIYRNKREFAVGHGVAAGWVKHPDNPKLASVVFTEFIPASEVSPVRGPEGLAEFNMVRLSEVETQSELEPLLTPLTDAYEIWLKERSEEKIEPPDDHVAEEHLEAASRSLSRMRTGIDLLAKDPIAFEAFKFANRAMAMQRRATERSLKLRRGGISSGDEPALWRPFQLGFILQTLPGLVDPNSEQREIADLLWYPTGGGKTEAYLGLTAFTLALRRLWGVKDGRDYSRGSAVLMRYTLRLLTLQQFQRALALMCACDQIRQEDPQKWGATRFEIGLWVGKSVTPNRYADARQALEKLRANERVFSESPYQILTCPWCGTALTPRNYYADDDLQRTLIKCSNRDCVYSARNNKLGIPAVVVDEEIYRHPPSLILATVDKFAQLTWDGRIKSLFGRVGRECERHGFVDKAHPASHKATPGQAASSTVPVLSPPAPFDLVIQDELHLISGPLGSLVGLYETTIDDLTERDVSGKPVKAKIVASTATVRRANTQLQRLYDRQSEIFPPLGLDSDNSFFAQLDQQRSGRLYLGVFGPGKSIKTTLVRIYAALLSRGLLEFENQPNPESDAYMTLVGYFNSLKELGGAVRLLEDDVPARIRVLNRRGFGPRRFLNSRRELTSRVPSYEVGRTLEELQHSFQDKGPKRYPVDTLLASNMLSVGVDIDRFGTIVVSGQPKTTAEYIQATSRIGRVHPGLVVQVYNWVRPRDISHYERFAHYHQTFYRHVEATSVTPFSERARDRALPAVFTAEVRQSVPGMADQSEAANFDSAADPVKEAIQHIVERARNVTGRDDVAEETRVKLLNLASKWNEWANDQDMPLVYSQNWGTDDTKRVLLKRMENAGTRGQWAASGSLRDVESEVDVVLSIGEGDD